MRMMKKQAIAVAVAVAMGMMAGNAIADEGYASKIKNGTITAVPYSTGEVGQYSTTMGDGTTASGNYSTAIGYQTKASGKYSTAMGMTTTAQGISSTAIGRSSKAIGNGSFAGGGYADYDSNPQIYILGSNAYGTNSFAFGAGAVAGIENDNNKQNQIAMGLATQATGNNAVAFGANSAASGSNSFAVIGGKSSGTNAVAIGSGATANADNSVALGTGSVATEAYTVSVGNGTTNNRIVNVGTPVNVTDAANKQYVDNSFNYLDNRMEKKVNRLGAKSAAIAALHPMGLDEDHKFSASAGLGTYGGQAAAAVGVFYKPNESWMINVGGAAGRGSVMGNIGVNYRFGSSGMSVRTSQTAMAQKVTLLEDTNRSIEAQLKASLSREEASEKRHQVEIAQLKKQNVQLQKDFAEMKSLVQQFLASQKK